MDSFWRSNTVGLWVGRLPPFKRCSASWHLYGQREAALIVLRDLWTNYLIQAAVAVESRGGNLLETPAVTKSILYRRRLADVSWMCARACACVYVCVCVCGWPLIHTRLHAVDQPLREDGWRLAERYDTLQDRHCLGSQWPPHVCARAPEAWEGARVANASTIAWKTRLSLLELLRLGLAGFEFERLP